MSEKIDRRKVLASAGAAGLALLSGTGPAALGSRAGGAAAEGGAEATPGRLLKSILSHEAANEALRKELRRRKSPLKSFIAVGDVEKLLKEPEKYPLGPAAFGPHQPETIVRVSLRPVLFVQNNTFVPETVQNEEIRKRLKDARKRLEAAIPAVGRVEVTGHGWADWLGTAWLVAENIVVTNRHVAAEFGVRQGDGFVFRVGPSRREMTARVNYLEEQAPVIPQLPFKVTKILHIEEDAPGRPDVAFLQVARSATDATDKLAKPIPLASKLPEPKDPVAVIGYPARDSRIPDEQIMETYFGGVYDVKRLSPGQVMEGGDKTQVLHDCTTLGGNSGSAVIDLNTGEAVGLHFAGLYRVANYAVPAPVIQERLKAIQKA